MKKAASLFILILSMYSLSAQTSARLKMNPLHELDQILSPFEDLTEYALDANARGVSKSVGAIIKFENSRVFKNYLTAGSSQVLHQKIARLTATAKQKNYKQVALIATDIFEFNINHFYQATAIANQLKIEHMDHLGFYALAEIQQQRINWKNLAITINSSQKIWDDLSKNLKDQNLKESFNLLFEGLHFCVKTKNTHMIKLLGSMDLALVDVLEKSF